MRPLDATSWTGDRQSRRVQRSHAESATSICSQSPRGGGGGTFDGDGQVFFLYMDTKGHEPQRGRIKLYLDRFVSEAAVQKSTQGKRLEETEKKRRKASMNSRLADQIHIRFI